jgi:nicotinamidase-related amidase
MFPWEGVIPDADIESFAGGAASMERPLEMGESPALVIVDMTRAFVVPGYPTSHSASGEPAVRHNAVLLAAARRLGMPIYFTKQYVDPTHVPTRTELGRWRPSQTQPASPELGPGDVLVEELTPRGGETVVYKELKPSAFFGTTFVSMLVADRVDTLIVTGMTTSGCVRATALDAFQHNFHVVIPHDACADRSQISHQVTLFDLHMKYADVASTASIIYHLER